MNSIVEDEILETDKVDIKRSIFTSRNEPVLEMSEQ